MSGLFIRQSMAGGGALRQEWKVLTQDGTVRAIVWSEADAQAVLGILELRDAVLALPPILQRETKA